MSNNSKIVWVVIFYLTVITVIISLLSLYLYKTAKKLSIRGNEAIDKANKTTDRINGLLSSVESAAKPVGNVIGNISQSIMNRIKRDE